MAIAKNPAPTATRLRTAAGPSAMACETRSARRFDGLNELCCRLLRVSVQHARVVEIEEGVLDSREARAFAALDHDDVLCLVCIQDRHAVDRARLVGARYGVH